MPRLKTPPERSPSLNPEKVAYWYFRPNGFLQIENFIVHPGRRGSQPTDADFLAVRFQHRAEFLFDRPEPMRDDEGTLCLSSEAIDVVIAEVKANQPCALNGPWTDRERQNVHRVLAAIGCVPRDTIDVAAAGIYRDGIYEDRTHRIRLIAVGGDKSFELAERFPRVIQVTWPQILDFIWHRLGIRKRRCSSGMDKDSCSSG